MQTLTELARMVVKWERRSLANGAYRLSGMQVLHGEASHIVRGYDNCSYDGQFHDELTCVKEALDLPAGVWVGMLMSVGSVTQVLALLME